MENCEKSVLKHGSGRYPLALKPLREEVYSFLVKLIRTRSIEPGKSINIESISKKFGISKTPMKEAVLRLESEGLVKAIPYRGYQVAGLNLKDYKEHYYIIGLLESTIVRRNFDRLIVGEVIGKLHKYYRKQEIHLKTAIWINIITPTRIFTIHT